VDLRPSDRIERPLPRRHEIGGQSGAEVGQHDLLLREQGPEIATIRPVIGRVGGDLHEARVIRVERGCEGPVIAPRARVLRLAEPRLEERQLGPEAGPCSGCRERPRLDGKAQAVEGLVRAVLRGNDSDPCRNDAQGEGNRRGPAARAATCESLEGRCRDPDRCAGNRPLL
jgi:hypothetical protein